MDVQGAGAQVWRAPPRSLRDRGVLVGGELAGSRLPSAGECALLLRFGVMRG